jgi:hypothetical protein
MEKIDFMWYLKNITLIAFVGFAAGAVVFFALHPFLEDLLGLAVQSAK